MGSVNDLKRKLMVGDMRRANVPDYSEIFVTKGFTVRVSPEDYEDLMQYSWFVQRGKHTWYACREVRSPEGKRTVVYMHRYIMKATEVEQVDHRDRNGLNNVRGNLRVATNQQNTFNSKKRSGLYKGVSRYHNPTKWRARIMFNGKGIHLGVFDTEAEAAIAYDIKAVELFGAFAMLNFPDGGEYDVRKA